MISKITSIIEPTLVASKPSITRPIACIFQSTSFESTLNTCAGFVLIAPAIPQATSVSIKDPADVATLPTAFEILLANLPRTVPVSFFGMSSKNFNSVPPSFPPCFARNPDSLSLINLTASFASDANLEITSSFFLITAFFAPDTTEPTVPFAEVATPAAVEAIFVAVCPTFVDLNAPSAF